VQVVNRTGRTIDTLFYAYGARVPGQSGTCVSPVPLAPAATATGIAAGARATLEPDAAATSLVVIRVRFGDGTGSPPADGRWRGVAQIGTAATRPLDGEARVDGVTAFIVGPTEQYRAAPGTPTASCTGLGSPGSADRRRGRRAISRPAPREGRAAPAPEPAPHRRAGAAAAAVAPPRAR